MAQARSCRLRRRVHQVHENNSMMWICNVYCEIQYMHCHLILVFQLHHTLILVQIILNSGTVSMAALNIMAYCQTHALKICYLMHMPL